MPERRVDIKINGYATRWGSKFTYFRCDLCNYTYRIGLWTDNDYTCVLETCCSNISYFTVCSNIFLNFSSMPASRRLLVLHVNHFKIHFDTLSKWKYVISSLKVMWVRTPLWRAGWYGNDWRAWLTTLCACNLSSCDHRTAVVTRLAFVSLQTITQTTLRRNRKRIKSAGNLHNIYRTDRNLLIHSIWSSCRLQ